jgi:hypothetical protein
LWPAVRGEVTTGGMRRRASMPLADSASGSGESHANVSVPPPNAQGDSKAATVLAIEICAKCWPCCRGAASEREWPSSPLPVASASPTEDLLLSMTSKLSARSSAVEPGSRPSGAKVAGGTNGPESALCDDQSSDQGWSSGDPLHALETAVPHSRNSPAGIFRGTHARGTIHERGGELARRHFWFSTLPSALCSCTSAGTDAPNHVCVQGCAPAPRSSRVQTDPAKTKSAPPPAIFSSLSQPNFVLSSATNFIRFVID